MKQEYIICSAIKLKDNRIIGGYRHCDCLINLANKTESIGRIEGFLTSKGRFVDRKEAYKIQHSAKINSFCIDGYSKIKELFSEDLY